MSVAVVDGAADTDVGTIGRQAARGLKWSLAGTAISKVGGFALGLVLARILAPTEYGIFAVAFAATQFVMMIKDLGVIAATSHWRGPLEEMTPTASSIALAFSTLLYGTVWLLAPAFASLAGNPDAVPVVRLLTAVILIEGVTAVRSGALMRNFRQDRIVTANIVGLVVNAALAITLAANGVGAMSLAAGQVAGATATGIIVVISARISFRFGFDPIVARWLLAFGLPLAGGLAVEAILLNADFIIIGALLDPERLGYYLLAFNISSWALTSITMSIRYVSVPSFSRLSERDDNSLSIGARRSVLSLYKVVMPIGALTAALASQIVVVLYGEAWSAAASVLRFLAVLTVVRVLVSLALDIFMGTGATRKMLLINAAWAAALIPALLVGVHLAGIRGAGIAHGLVGLGVALPLTILELRRLGVDLAPIFPALLRPTVAGALAAASAVAVTTLLHSADFLELLLAGSTGIAAYACVTVTRADFCKFTAVASNRLSRTKTLVPDRWSRSGQVSPRSPKPGYHLGLDGLRAIAVMTVVVFHARSSLFPGGYIGVDIFFVLSGYLISSLLLAEWSRAGKVSLKEFYIRRALRLLPALVVLCTSVLVVLWANPGLPEHRDTLTGVAATISYSSSPIAALGGGLGWMLHTWSLSVEEYFYLVWPVALVALCILAGQNGATRGRLTNWMITFVVLAVSYRLFAGLQGWNISRIAYAPDTRAEQLLIGAALAVMLPALSKRVGTGIALLSGAFMAIFVLAPSSFSSHIYRYGGSTCIALMSAALIAHIVQRPLGPASRWLGSSPLVWLGRRSYGIYLWNLPIVGFIATIGMPGPLEAPAKLFLSLLIPALSYAIVESPFLRLKRRYRSTSVAPGPMIDPVGASPALQLVDP